MRNSIVVAGLSSLLVSAWAVSVAGALEGELATAQKLASETGRPLLVVAGTDT